jgi:hypothetical protein
MKDSLKGVSALSATNIEIAKEEAAMRAMTDEQKEKYLEKQANMTLRKQELENQRLIRKEKADEGKENEKRNRTQSFLTASKDFWWDNRFL